MSRREATIYSLVVWYSIYFLSKKHSNKVRMKFILIWKNLNPTDLLDGYLFV